MAAGQQQAAKPREAKRLGRANPKTGKRRSLRRIAAELARIGEALVATGTPGAKEAAQAYFARNGHFSQCWRTVCHATLPDSVRDAWALRTRQCWPR
jgi:hypothetical protein